MNNLDTVLDLFGQNTIDLIRSYEDRGNLISIPRDNTGIRVEPGTFSFEFTSSDNMNHTGLIEDNLDGKLILTRSTFNSSEIQIGQVVGDIIYPHGIAIITELGNTQEFYNTISGSRDYLVQWKSNHPIFTTTYLCKVSDYELNYTLNPSAIIPNTEGEYIESVTGRDFRTYITSLGLYNDSNELLAVAKFSQPIPKSSDVDMTFVIKLDY